MKRRRLVLAPGAAALIGAAATVTVHAQGARAKRLGILAMDISRRPEYLQMMMKERGWEVGRDLIIVRRSAEGDLARLPVLANELVAERVDVILAVGDGPALAAASATRSIPIVMQGLAPVRLGLANSLARPGGNVTGAVYLADEYVGKQVDLLRALQPGLARIGVYGTSDPRLSEYLLKTWRDAADRAGIATVELPYPYKLGDIDGVLAAAERERVQALRIGLHQFLRNAGGPQIRGWAVGQRVITTAPPLFREAVLGFGTSEAHFDAMWFDQLDRVLRGANPADLPILQPTKFEIIVHRGQLREMGLPVPSSVLLQATEVID